MISRNIDIVVTSVLQTTAGKMIFGRYIEGQASAAAATPAPAPAAAVATPPAPPQAAAAVPAARGAQTTNAK
jgi:hypothetical protein